METEDIETTLMQGVADMLEMRASLLFTGKFTETVNQVKGSINLMRQLEISHIANEGSRGKTFFLETLVAEFNHFFAEIKARDLIAGFEERENQTAGATGRFK